MRLRMMIVSVVAAGQLVLAAHGANAAEAGAGRVVIKDFMFAPTTITVKAGSVVTWLNKDEEPHTIFSDAGLFRSGALDTNDNFQFKFDKPGTYHYVCTIHPKMVGTIVVE